MTSYLSGDILTADALNLRPYLHVYQASGAAQSIANNTPTAITFTLEVSDTIAGHSTTVNTSQYTPIVSGLYECHGMVAFETNCSGKFVAQFRKNGIVDVGASYSSEVADTNAFSGNTALASATIRCNGSSDSITLIGSTNFGSTKSTLVNTGDGVASFMIIRWVAP